MKESEIIKIEPHINKEELKILFKNVLNYNKVERNLRILELIVRNDLTFLELLELLELNMIQTIREMNGEIQEVLNNRNNY